MEIQNKPTFYTGLLFQVIQFLGIGIFGLTLLDWSWFNSKVIIVLGIILIIVFYNSLSIMMMYWSVKKKCNIKSGKGK